MEQKFQFESLVFWKGEGDSVCVVDEGGGAEVRLPAGVWERLARRFEAELIRAALEATGGRRVEAALKLGIGRNTITRKIRELGLD